MSAPRDHERTDADVPFILGVALLLVLLAGAIFLSVGGLFKRLNDQPRAADPTLALSRVKPNPGFPQPRLQISPQTDLKTFEDREQAELTGYGWVDRQKKIVRIPIDLAMDLALQHGFPVRSGTAAPANGETPLQLIQARPLDYNPPNPASPQAAPQRSP